MTRMIRTPRPRDVRTLIKRSPSIGDPFATPLPSYPDLACCRRRLPNIHTRARETCLVHPFRRVTDVPMFPVTGILRSAPNRAHVPSGCFLAARGVQRLASISQRDASGSSLCLPWRGVIASQAATTVLWSTMSVIGHRRNLTA